MTYFCARCWSPLDGQEKTCPACGCDLASFSELSAEEKFILALDHPVADNQMIAVRMLGRLGSRRALPGLEKILRDPQADYYLLSEVLEALAGIRDPHCLELIKATAKDHPHQLVRAKARAVLQSMQVENTSGLSPTL
jgi:HEAT repeat protein